MLTTQLQTRTQERLDKSVKEMTLTLQEVNHLLTSLPLGLAINFKQYLQQLQLILTPKVFLSRKPRHRSNSLIGLPHPLCASLEELTFQRYRLQLPLLLPRNQKLNWSGDKPLGSETHEPNS